MTAAPRFAARLRSAARSPLGRRRRGPRRSTPTPTTVAGSVGYDRATLGVETITINSPSAIINWVPNVAGDPIIFLPAGNVATFLNGINNTNFAVLNRIHRPTSRSASTAPCSAGCRIPALGTSRAGRHDPLPEPRRHHRRAERPVRRRQSRPHHARRRDRRRRQFHRSERRDPVRRRLPAPNAAVITEPGSQIRALDGEQLRRDDRARSSSMAARSGSTARPPMSPAKRSQMRVNDGLFDIIVTVGSDNAVAARSTPARPAARPAPAAPTITASTWSRCRRTRRSPPSSQGNVGFDPAVNAAVENGAIVLSAGYSRGQRRAGPLRRFRRPPRCRGRRELPDPRRHDHAPTCSALRSPTCWRAARPPAA